MIRKLCLLASLAVPVSLFAQGATPANQAPGSQSSSTVVMPGTNVYVVGGGLYGTGVYVTPGAAVGSNAGISLAGRAGISLNEPMQLGVQSTLVPSWPPYPIGVYSGYAGGYYGASPEAAGAENLMVAQGAARPDLGPSYAAVDEPQAAPVSLGEVSAYYKRNHHQNVRTYTNADAQRFTNTVTIPRTKPGATTPPPQTAPPPPR